MPTSTPHRNGLLLGWLRAAAIAGLTWAGMVGVHAGPAWLPIAMAAGAGALALLNPEIGVLLAIAGVCLPILAVNPIVGIILAVILFSAERYLGGGGADEFLLIGLAVVGAFFGPVWAAAALAGYLLGPGTGALAAVVACVTVELLGILTAQPTIGGVITGGQPPAAVALSHAPATLLSFHWISAAFKSISPHSVSSRGATFTHISHPVALVAQIACWALGAVAAGLLAQRAGQRSALWMPLAGVALGVAIIWAGDIVVRGAFSVPSAGATSALALGSSLTVALAVVLARESVFAPVPVVRERPEGARPATLATEDADVDDLLRLIATAEDKLAAQHTAQRVVLITDMKSFSRATEEDGSVATAKAIQRHRDLLVPIISANHGCGKSTGGDGVVAAFESAADAIRAAVEGQKALAAYNLSHHNEREIWVRMGLAYGEVVLDKGGRPFIGAGLNLAARVMNLADGGQVFATAKVAADAPTPHVRAESFGPFQLKNIADPVEIAELLWGDDQSPRDPRTQPAEA